MGIELLTDLAIKAPTILLYLDFDGTLVNLRANPEHCTIQPRLAKVLEDFSRLSGVDLAVISGRSLADLSRRLPMDQSCINLAGNHGLELKLRGDLWQDPRAVALQGHLDQFEAEARERLKGLAGAWVEHKGLSLSLHGRQLSPAKQAEMEQRLAPLLGELKRTSLLQLRRGRRVLEIRPAFAHGKAEAAQRLERDARRRGVCSTANHRLPLKLYFGDDDTDEDVFQQWPGVVGVRVGPWNQPTTASFRLGGPAGVNRWIHAVFGARCKLA